MILTPLSKDGTKRLRLEIKDCNLPRGCAGRQFEVETLKGEKLKLKVVSCGVPRCNCDAQIL